MVRVASIAKSKTSKVQITKMRREPFSVVSRGRTQKFVVSRPRRVLIGPGGVYLAPCGLSKSCQALRPCALDGASAAYFPFDDGADRLRFVRASLSATCQFPNRERRHWEPSGDGVAESPCELNRTWTGWAALQC